MQDIIHLIQALDKPFITATVVKTWGSGPRKVGSGMVIAEDGTIYGSVSGGCVEGDVIKNAGEVRQTGLSRLLQYGITDDEAWEVGLSCGGKIDILLEYVDLKENASWAEAINLVQSNRGSVLLSPLEGKNSQQLVLSNSGASSALERTALDVYRSRKSGIYEINGNPWFLNVFPKKSTLVIVGAAHISSQLVELAHMHDFETVVVDPRGLFTDNTDFRVEPDASHKKWPAELLEEMDLNSDVFAVTLTHDPKIDDQALEILLKSDVAYIGSLGSSRTHEKRKKRLTESGFSEEQIGRIHAPIGVDINAKSPKEIALSIVGELIKTRNQYL